MTLVFAGVASHGPGITGRSDRADPAQRDALYSAYEKMRDAIDAVRPDALMIVAAEHFANFFQNNMPSYAIGMADSYTGPIEDPVWLGIPRRIVKGAPDLSERIIQGVMQNADIAFAQEWQLDHGIMVPLHFLDPDNRYPLIPANINCQGPPLTPLARAWNFGTALRAAIDAVPERIALVGTGGISHWPATPDSGKINESWDRDFLDRWSRNDHAALTAYSDAETLREAGQGGFEIRTFITVAATAGGQGHVWHYQPIPIFAVGCTIGVMEIL